MYSDLKRKTKVALRRAQRQGLPDWLADHVERRMGYAEYQFRRTRGGPLSQYPKHLRSFHKEMNERAYGKAVSALSDCLDVMGAFPGRPLV